MFKITRTGAEWKYLMSDINNNCARSIKHGKFDYELNNNQNTQNQINSHENSQNMNVNVNWIQHNNKLHSKYIQRNS